MSITSWELELAEADLDAVIRATAKQQNKSLMQAARKRHDRFIGLAAKAKDKEAGARYKQTAPVDLIPEIYRGAYGPARMTTGRARRSVQDIRTRGGPHVRHDHSAVPG